MEKEGAALEIYRQSMPNSLQTRDERILKLNSILFVFNRSSCWTVQYNIEVMCLGMMRSAARAVVKPVDTISRGSRCFELALKCSTIHIRVRICLLYLPNNLLYRPWQHDSASTAKGGRTIQKEILA